MVHTYDGMLLGHKKEETMPFTATRMQLEIILLREVSRQEKDKCHRTPLPYHLKSDTNEPIYKTSRVTDIEDRQAKRRGLREG